MLRTRFVSALAFVLATPLLANAASAPMRAGTPPGTTDVRIDTTKGSILVRLDLKHAPITTGNFLRHVDAHVYDRGASFYRSIPPGGSAGIAILQGGVGGTGRGPDVMLEPTSTTGLHNVPMTIAMARTQDPNSGNSEFFINTGDNRGLDEGGYTGAGYAVFGTIVGGENVVKAIQEGPTTGDRLQPPIPIVRIVRVRR